MGNLDAIRDHVVTMLNEGLSKALVYHDVHHTLDVTSHCVSLAKQEGITNAQILFELEVAALYHDLGFLFTYQDHEERGCVIAREELPGFGLSEESIDTICGLIMATKVPQSPLTDLQKIICDADLDYLGREDFFETGDKLRRELIAYNFISTEHDWEERQLQFLQSHHYFTKTSQSKREPFKEAFIKQLLKTRNIKAR